MLAIILALVLITGVFVQESSPADIILLLNTSSGMSSSYETVSNYITGPFLREFLRLGDTFHLIPFSGSPRVDASRRIEGLGDIETIIGRMLLQYPLESGNEINAAISFSENYVNTLPQRPKMIVLVSTGSQEIQNLINAANQRNNSRDITFHYILVNPGQPLTNLPVSGRQPLAIPPSSIISEDTFFTDTAAGTIITGETELGAYEEQITIPGTQAMPGTADSITAPVSTAEKTSNIPINIPINIIAALIAVILVIGLLIFLIIRKSRPKDDETRPKGTPPDYHDTEEKYPIKEEKYIVKEESKKKPAGSVVRDNTLANFAASKPSQRTNPYADRPVTQTMKVLTNPSAPVILNLFVEEQNTAIGKRNIHSLKSGHSLTVGGGNSDFLIFLVHMPPSIGEIRRDAGKFTYNPRKPKHFPELGSSELRDCIDKTIRVISDKKFEIRIRFELYEDPLITLNRMLNSLKSPEGLLAL
jgi:preprotein translocase subunit SecG